MTQARELFAKISEELDRATRERDEHRARLDEAMAQNKRRDDELTAIARTLLPKAANAMEDRFGRYAEAVRTSKADLEAAEASLAEAQEVETSRMQEHATASREFGENAETRRRIMIETPDYKEAVKALADADVRLKINAQLIRTAEQKLGRLTELARQNPVHSLLLDAGRLAKGGHFILSMLNTAGDRIRSTEWYRRADADRVSAEAVVVERQRSRTEIEESVHRNQAVIDRMKVEYDRAIQPAQSELFRLKEAAGQALRAREQAEAFLASVRRAARAVEDMTTPEAKADLARLVAVLSASPSAEEEVLEAIRSIPGAAPSIRRAAVIADETAAARLSIIELRETLEAAGSAVDELDKVRRKMKRSGMSSSSRNIANVESFMASGGSDGFDLGTIVMIAAVSDSISDASPSSHSSDSSSYSSSSFD